MSRKRGERIDVLLVERGWFRSRARAQASVMEGSVYADGQRVLKAGERFAPGVSIEVKDRPQKYVSRGGAKIERPMELFPVEVEGRVALDAGASTGGFTDYLLRRGARRVYAVDVGYGQLDWRLRQDPRVVVMERTNVRYLRPDQLGGPVDLVTADLSFISLTKVLARLRAVLRTAGEMLVLVKPQFEAGRGEVGSGGVVRDPDVRARALDKVLTFASGLGLAPLGLTYSPIRGPKGNVEFWMWLRLERSVPGAPPPAGSAGRDGVPEGGDGRADHVSQMRRQIANVVQEAEQATRSHRSRPDDDGAEGG